MQKRAEAAYRGCIIWLQSHRLLEQFEGFGVLAHGSVGDPEAILGQEVRRVHLDGHARNTPGSVKSPMPGGFL